jgi:hypothetical protein
LNGCIATSTKGLPSLGANDAIYNKSILLLKLNHCGASRIAKDSIDCNVDSVGIQQLL